MQSGHRLLTLLGVVGALALGPAAQAQINPFRGKHTRLSSEDLTMMNQTAAGLYQADGIAPGSSAPWSNPKSGNSGVVSIRDTTTQHGMLCHLVNYQVRIKGVSSARNYAVTWCRTSSGEWRIR
jgi:hypothetical protein